ncbi:hypothetical protein [Legionella gresilensis]|nr:hypothetical protein [Legionella gresilensis]
MTAKNNPFLGVNSRFKINLLSAAVAKSSKMSVFIGFVLSIAILG